MFVFSFFLSNFYLKLSISQAQFHHQFLCKKVSNMCCLFLFFCYLNSVSNFAAQILPICWMFRPELGLFKDTIWKNTRDQVLMFTYNNQHKCLFHLIRLQLINSSTFFASHCTQRTFYKRKYFSYIGPVMDIFIKRLLS